MFNVIREFWGFGAKKNRTRLLINRTLDVVLIDKER